MEVLNRFCAIKQSRPDFQYSPVQQTWGTAWSCTLKVIGCHLISQCVSATQEEAKQMALKDFVGQLHAQGLTKGGLGKMAKGLGKSSLDLTSGPSWGLGSEAGGAQIITEAESKSKYQKGKGKGKGKDKKGKKITSSGVKMDNGFVGNLCEKLRCGVSTEGLDMVHQKYGFNSQHCMTVDQFATCIAAIGIRCPEKDALVFFDGIDTMELVKYPDMPSASYFNRFARWAVREFLAEGHAAVERTRDMIPQMLERQGVCIQRLIAQPGERGGMEIDLMAEGGAQLPKSASFVRSDWLMITVPALGKVHIPDPGVVGPTETGALCVEAECVGFQPGGFGPQNGLKVKIVGAKPQVMDQILGQQCRVDRIANRVTFNRQMDALKKLCGDPGDLSWLSGILMAYEELGGSQDASSICNVRPEGAGFPSGSRIMDGMNTSQMEALTAATSRRMTLIQGPPGAGKTHTSIALMRLWCQAGRGPILACADSNVAVDNLVMGCIKAKLTVTRVGRAEASHAQLNDYNLYEKCKAEGGAVSGARGKYAEERKILEASDVICCTCAGSSHPVFHGMRFKGVLVDEAGQATELSTLVPLSHLDAVGACALVGDHKQLPATVACMEADIEGLGNSLFERLAAQGVHSIMLNTQYRMHPAIAAYPSMQYYGGMLRSGVRGTKRNPPQGIQWPVPEAPVTFLPVEGRETKEGNSYTNAAEINAIAELLRAVVAGGEVKAADIGIITPYAAQVRYIRQALGIPNRNEMSGPAALAQLLNSPDVASVDGFQGREKEVIFMSPVRANEMGNVGFTGDPRRLNVSFTRAKRGLVVCGHFPTLSKDANGWQPWLLWAQQRGLIAGCAATDPEAQLELKKLNGLSESELMNPGVDMEPTLLAMKLIVKEGVGAGLNLNPESRGMRVLGVLPEPGQPGVQAGDLIVQIGGANLGPDAETTVEIFEEQFAHGREVIIERAPC